MSPTRSKTPPTAQLPPSPPLVDEHGPIPTFPPRQLDEYGRLIPISDEDRNARRDAALRTIAALRNEPDEDPLGIEQEMMRGIDSRRAPGQKLFEGMH